MPLNIDIQQILLHMLNFTILFFALYFLLYKPIRNFNSKRDKYFKEMEKKTGGAMEEANKIKKEYEEKIAAVGDEAEKIIAAAEEQASKKSDIIISNAKQEANSIILKAKTRANKEISAILSSANKEIRELAEQAAEKIVIEGTLESYESFLEAVENTNEEKN
jgi:F-type H+-transporting ATPase subunit b